MTSKSISAAGSSISSSLNQIVYFALLATIALTSVPYGTIQPWWIAAFEVLIFLIAILAVVEMTLSGVWPRKLGLVAPLVAIVIYSVLQSLPLLSGPGPIHPRIALSADPFGTRLFAMQLMALAVMVTLLLHYASTSARLHYLVYTLVGIAVASAVFGIARRQLQHAPGFILPALPLADRSFGQFINRNHFALLLEMGIGLTIGLMFNKEWSLRRLFILIPLGGLLWATLIYAASRGGIVACLCQLLFIAVLLDPIRYLVKPAEETESRRVPSMVGGVIVRVFAALVLVGVFIYGVGWIGGEPVVTNFQLVATDFSKQEVENNGNTSRKDIWLATWKAFKANPITGIGFGGYWIGITQYHHASGEITPQQAHNDYLELLASGGLIGAALAIWFLTAFVRRALRNVRSPDAFGRAVCLGALAGIFGVAIHSVVDFGLHLMVNVAVFFGLIVVAAQNSQVIRPSLRRPSH